MKKLVFLFKYFDRWTNSVPTVEEEAQRALDYLILTNDTVRSFEVFEALELMFMAEMKKREQHATKVSKLISNKYKSIEIINMPVVDFEYLNRPLKGTPCV